MINILGVIGLRSGSKGLKNKNILSFLGKPLASHIISKSLKSKYINRLIVSTDSEYYAKIAKKYGAEIPYLRPKKLSRDKSNEIDFIKHLLNFLEKKEGYKPDLIVRLLSTVPLQTTSDIDNSIKKLLNNKSNDSCVVISEGKQHPQKSIKINNSNYLVSYITGRGEDLGKNQNRNQFKKSYFRSNIVSTRLSTIQNFNSLTGRRNVYHIIPQRRSIDIDTRLDFEIAEFIAKKK